MPTIEDAHSTQNSDSSNPDSRAPPTNAKTSVRKQRRSTVTHKDQLKIEEREQREDLEERKEFIRDIAKTILSSVIFFVITTVFYSHRMSWTTTEAMYFSMVTMSTVGYGDFSPDDNFWNRLFTILTIFTGVIAIFSSIASTFATLLQPFLSKMRNLLEKKFPQHEVDIDGDGTPDFKMPRTPVIYYTKNMLPGIMLVVFCQIISSLIFMSIEEWDFGTAMYHCIVTATTVGYGDVKIAKQGGMRFAFFHILLSVCLLGALISDFGVLQEDRKKQLERVEQLKRKLDADLIESLMLRVKELRPDVDHDKGISELEFTLAMLIQLEMVEETDVKPFIKQFRSLDADGSGWLTSKDLEEMTAKIKQNTQQAAAALRGQHAHAPHLVASKRRQRAVIPNDGAP